MRERRGKKDEDFREVERRKTRVKNSRRGEEVGEKPWEEEQGQLREGGRGGGKRGGNREEGEN